ncbi:HAMP domain-containing sensor histidine kinase [Spirillospora sp. NPDC047418]
MSARNGDTSSVRPRRYRPVPVTPDAAGVPGLLPAAAVAAAAAVLHLLGGVRRPGVLAAVMTALAAAASALAARDARRAAARALAPLGRLQQDLAALDETGPGDRVGVPPTGDDVERLAGRVNVLLERLERVTVQRRSFIADASHELRTPLTGLRTRIELALDEPDRADADSLRRALADIDRLHRIVEDLLILARLDSGDAPDRDRFDLGRLVETEVARRSPPVPTTVRVEPGVTVEASGPRVGRAVGNLLANAERHAVARIEVSVCARGGDAVVEVRDDGPGIPLADRDRVFDRFARLDTARSRADGGSGLGLPIAREVAVAYGGRVYVAAGTGARLVLRLPLAH